MSLPDAKGVEDDEPVHRNQDDSTMDDVEMND